MSDLPIFAGWEPHKWRVCVPRLGGFGTVKRNTGRWPVRQREFFPLLLRSGLSGVKTPLDAQTAKSVFLGSRDGGKKKQ
jgi:hypothetical protein